MLKTSLKTRVHVAKQDSILNPVRDLVQRAMVRKSMLVVLLSGIQSVRILPKRIVYRQIRMLINVFVWFRGHLVSVYLKMYWRSCLHSVFRLAEAGKNILVVSLGFLRISVCAELS